MNNLSLSKLYATGFCRLAAQHLSAAGIIVMQATSPSYAPEALWCVAKTISSAPVGPEGQNRLDDQMIVNYNRNGWKRFNQ